MNKKGVSQRTIDTFFKGGGEKRKVCSSENLESPKRNKNEEEDGGKVTSRAGSITPEQKRRMENNGMSARLKLLSKTVGVVDPCSIGLSWYKELLEMEFKKPYFKELSDYYMKACSNATVYPSRENIFSWTRYCDIRDVKVVIIGQDPYHGVNQAHGLCFSVIKGVPTPPSLLNMFKELVNDENVPEFNHIPKHGCLEGWATQGVLLLNAVLTVEKSKANSHKDVGWETLTTAVIKWISNNLRNVVFLLWGAYAQKKANVVDKSKHVCLMTPHPSPLSAHKGFFGSKPFSKCNDALIQNNIQPILWHQL
ncbi:unnamed protein product [Orchesella dallaii]|uniref:Uracil-DNA glycosylase n=1 Tax=Orchesella dallaii TaxID=48710 RepID=A0ABP1QXB1_9HEXA